MANHALIIANGAFSDTTISSLSSPVSDGRMLKSLLERSDVGGYHVNLCVDGNSLEVRHAIQEFFDAGSPDDLQLLVISSHGLKDRWSRLYFATADTLKGKVAASSLEPRFIRERMDDSSAGRKVLIIDACYSGAFLDGMVHKRGADLNITSQDFGDPSAGGTTIITASSKVQIAGEQEIDGSTQSVFTRCMIEGIETGAADFNKSGLITLSDLYDYVSRRLKTEAPGQTPQWLDMSHGGPIVIARNPNFRAVALPEELQARINSRIRAERISAVEDLEDIARSTGAEASLARDALSTLAMDDSYAVRELARAISDRVWPSKVAAPLPNSEISLLLSRSPEKSGFLKRTLHRLSVWGKSFVFIIGGLGVVLMAIMVVAIVIGVIATAISQLNHAAVSNNSLEVIDNLSSEDEMSEDNVLTPAKAGDLAVDESNAKRYTEAFKHYVIACDGGDARGCSNLGIVYKNGEGVDKDYNKAAIYYRKGCDRADMMGCTNLGVLYEEGTGVKKNYSLAIKNYRQGCDGGDMTGCTYLGTMYEGDEFGLGRNYGRAAELYRKGCDGDVARGCAFLAELYESGHGVTKNAATSLKLYKQALKIEPTLDYAKEGVARLK